jgi:NAD-dependent SIR2 family protein deacetylase
MRIIKKFYCTGCKKIEISATPENPSKCPKCGEIRVLMDVWILKGDWVEEKKISSYQQDLMKYKGRSRHTPEGG